MSRRKIWTLAVCVLLAALLSGCSARTLDEMYSLPRRSARNESLRSAVEAEMQTRSYAAPVSGDNQENVQAADLDGDGQDEYIVYTRNVSDNTLQILVFHQDDAGNFGIWKRIDCKGSSFEQVSYAQVDDRPGCELIVGVRISERVTRTVAVYSFGSGETEKLKSMIYVRYLCTDLDEDGHSEILVIQNGADENSLGVSRLYAFSQGNIEGSEEIRLSGAPDDIRKITVNRFADGPSAVYVTSTWSSFGVITDILSYIDGRFANTFQAVVQDVDSTNMLPEDIDDDGILELPSLLPMRYSTAGQNLVCWYAFDSEAGQKEKCYTYHSPKDGWYIVLNQSWTDRITVEKKANVYTFYMWNNSYGTAVPVFSVYVLQGKDRDLQAAAQNRFALHRGDEIVYSAKLESASAIYGITENYLTEHFFLIRAERKTAES